MGQETLTFDFVVIGAGSAGCAVAAGLAKANVGSIAVLEAGFSDKVPQVKIPFGLVYTRGSKRDWQFKSAKQKACGDKQFNVTRGKMLGGSSSINSMVWFRGRRDDFDGWNVKGWKWADVEREFEEVEEKLTPQRFPYPHPTASAYALALGDNGEAPPTPERESAGIFHVNMRDGARWSAADAFLRPAEKNGNVSVITKANVDRIVFEGKVAKHTILTDGRTIKARRGIILSAGAIGSPSILMRSGIGKTKDLKELGISVELDAPQIGQNLHDHPAVGLHFAGPKSGYGLELAQFPNWALSPFNWLFRRKGRLTSQVVEAGAFFRAAPVGEDGDDRPDCQSHFIPFMVGYKKSFVTWGAGYSGDVNICRPHSRGTLSLVSKDPNIAPSIDPALLSDNRDVVTLMHGVRRLRKLLENAPFENHRAPEVYPGKKVESDEEIKQFVRERCATAYHPVGTVRMGDDKTAPLSSKLKLKGFENLWVADASIMPAITTANTNAPSMMIGHRAAKFIVEDTRMAS